MFDADPFGLVALDPNILNVFVAVAFIHAPAVFRIARGAALDLRSRDDVQAALTRGEDPWYMMRWEILPKARGALIVDFCLRIGHTTILLGALGFFGLAVSLESPDWGSTISERRKLMSIFPHIALVPALCLVSFVLGLNLLANALREESLRDYRPPPSPRQIAVAPFGSCLPGGIAILPDLTRALPVADAVNHHLFASLGCAAETRMLAAGADGRSAALDFVAEGEGRVESALGQGASRDGLFDAILSRQCTRSEYDGRAVPVADLAALEASARVEGAEVMLLGDPAMIAQVPALILMANAAQVSDPAFAAELKSWLRFNARSAVETGDGLFAATSGNPSLPTFPRRSPFERVFTVTAENDRYARQVRSSSGLAIIHSDRDDPAHRVQAGRSHQRLALQATALGIRNAHLNQPVEVANTRPQLQALLGLGERRPDMVLRFGHAAPMPRSLRRPIAAVIET